MKNPGWVEEVHISQVRAGDTVHHAGKVATVCAKDLKRSPLVGQTLFGDSYRLGTLPVLRVDVVEWSRAEGA